VLSRHADRVTIVSTTIPRCLERLPFRYPSFFVDDVIEHEPGRRLVGVKSVTVNEEYFQGHFPGAPVMPGVLMIETLLQGATVLLLAEGDSGPRARVYLRGVDGAKFRRQVTPGDQVRFELTRTTGRAPLVRVHGVATVEGQLAAEADLLLLVVPDRVHVDSAARVHPGARVGDGTTIGPHAVIGEHVRIGCGCTIGSGAIIDGRTEIGDDNRISPHVSIGLPPQDLKYAGEPTRVVIGRSNIIREFVTIHRGTQGGGGVTSIGDRNLLMAYVHVAHDCHIGSDIIFGNAATLGGHVTVGNFVNLSAFSGVHQFCRIGVHAFIGGYSVITKDALPFAKTVGSRPARLYGLNTIGLGRRGFPAETIRKLRQAYRYLHGSHLNTTHALGQIEADRSVDCPEVRAIVDFIRTSGRGVILRRGRPLESEAGADEE
jgi:UDP-N-acetylglucosamine acyltransferase